MKLILKIYDWFSAHKTFMWLSLTALTLLFAVLLLRLKFSENISDFLPLDSTDREALAVYQNISGAGRLYFLFDNPDDELLTVEAMEYFAARVEEKDSLGWCRELVLGVDMSKIKEVSDFVYANMPYFLTSSDYERMDSLLSTPGFVRERLENDRNMLLFPSGGMLSSSISRDPLGLFSPVMSSLESSAPGVGFEICDGYIFTPDMSRAVAMMDSPFGNSETEHNSRLLKMLRESMDEMEREFPAVSAEIVGGPEIAVGNSSRIKKDSIIAVSLSLVLILLLAAYSISSLRNILLLFLSIGWGWLFAMAGVSLFCGSVSMIVIGISSVILGIAVNYPLHLVVHSSYAPSMRRTIREIISPLVVGNITTVGAFLALVPLKAVALRDLGLFASLLLAGTIVFVLLYLPHFVEIRPVREGKHRLLDRLCELRPDRSKGLVGLILVLTTILIIAIWMGIIGILIKTDVGGFGSTVLYPLLKDVPYVNKILPQPEETVEQTEGTEHQYGSLSEAISQIKELEKELDEASSTNKNDKKKIKDLKAQIKDLSKYKEDEAAFEKEKEKYYEEVVFSDQAPDIQQYKTYYESIDPENAEVLYKQVVEQITYDSQVEDYAKTYSNMKPQEAASIFDTMTDNLGLVADILMNMGTQQRADILGKMDATTAAKLTEIMEPSKKK